jgi:hypothetical protein
MERTVAHANEPDFCVRLVSDKHVRCLDGVLADLEFFCAYINGHHFA